MIAYKELVRNHDEFHIKGVPMTADEYEGEVIKLFASPIAQNEIHRLLNAAADILVRQTKSLEETAAYRGELRFGERMLELGKRKKATVTVNE